jgi:hypothetical protein
MNGCASAIGLCEDLSDCEDKLLRLPYRWMIARQALSCLRGRRDGRLKMVVRKLKAAISIGGLALSRCNAVTSTWSLRDIIPPAGGFRISSVPRPVVVHALTAASRCQRYPSRQPKFGEFARLVCVRLRRPLGGGRGASQCQAPKPGCWNIFWIA